MATIPKEQQTAFQRWEMTSFGDERASTLAARQAEQQALEAQHAQELQELQLQQTLLEQQQQLAEIGPPLPPPPTYPSVEEVEAIREQARLDGYEEGHAAGHADALALGKIESAKELEHLQALTASFGTAVQQADQLIANDVLELALQLAKGMLKTALHVKPELVLPIVREAIEYLPVLQQPALLVLHPDDASVVREGIGEELDKGGWRVIEDPSVGRGGCKVDTASNQIDAQAASRWQRLTHALGKDVDWLA
ncbi:flagellar assembly protein FliH [Rugamonas apoptosis]|uniref:Flagellar assembly protein FliH n=1 Tax=Rugamonas apoptosis TaxID=2758570 RepID=A0A7W2F7A2_9BURK|nr:flagellar assembly protein FliH [Rugamonas apoptosis]MBA5686423.1 flagellar assembly protein FliH [Rugamonas apoptosis]